MSRASNEVLDALHAQLARTLADKIKNGEATAADLSVARQFLKDNGIEAVPTPKSPLADLAGSLPFAGSDLPGATH